MNTNNNNTPLPLGGAGGRLWAGGLRIGILGAAGYTGGELIRLLLNHPQADIVFANSESNAGNLLSDVHEGLYAETDMRFTEEMPFDKVDVVFFCFGHGKSEQFLKEHSIPANVKIIDLAQDFRIKGDHDYVYGLPEIHRQSIAKAQPPGQSGLLRHGDTAGSAACGKHGAHQGQCKHQRNNRLYGCRTEANVLRTLLLAQRQPEHLQAAYPPAPPRSVPKPQRSEVCRCAHDRLAYR